MVYPIFLGIIKRDSEGFLDAYGEFNAIERIETQAILEERSIQLEHFGTIGGHPEALGE
jgi:hypothetical protein